METLSTYDIQANDFLNKTGATITKEFKKFDYHFNGDESKRNVFQITISRNGKKMVFDFGQSLSDSCKKTLKLFSKINEPVEIYAGLSQTRTGVGMNIRVQTSVFDLRDIYDGKKEFKSLYDSDMLNESLKKCLSDINEHNKNPKNKYNPIENLWTFKAERLEEVLIKSINAKINDLLKETVLIEQDETITEPTNYDILSCLTKYNPETFKDFCDNYGYSEDSIKALKTYKAVKKEFNDLKTLFSDEEITELQEIN